MNTIRRDDFIQSVADGFQFISYYHPTDYIKALSEAYEQEQSPAAKEAMAQILINSRMCAEGHRPICQDTGIAIVFIKAGMDVRWDTDMSIEDMVNEGVRRAYTDKDNTLRASILDDPDGSRNDIGIWGGPYAASSGRLAHSVSFSLPDTSASPGDTLCIPMKAVTVPVTLV